MQMVRGRKRALRTLMQKVSERIGDLTHQYIGITHADDPETAKEIDAMIKEAFPKSRTFIRPIGGVLGTHLGIGGVGIFFSARNLSPIYTWIKSFLSAHLHKLP